MCKAKFPCNNVVWLSIISLIFLNYSCNTRNTTEEYVFATYNLRYENSNDNKNGHSWEERLPEIIRVIKKYDFDILGTQEPFYSQVLEVSQRLPEYDHFGL